MNMPVSAGDAGRRRHVHSSSCGTRNAAAEPSAARSREPDRRLSRGNSRCCSLLHIENIAVIEQADISFDRGFNVLTGETGAGKSIVIDAISAILGERAYRDMIRTGAQIRPSVQRDFYRRAGAAVVRGQRRGHMTRRLVVSAGDLCWTEKMSAASTASLVTVSMLRKLGVQLINIHGQHDSAVRCLTRTTILLFWTHLPENEALRSDYRREIRDCRRSCGGRCDRLTMDEGEKLRRMETLQYQIDEIEQAELEPGEDERLGRPPEDPAERRKADATRMEAAVDALYGGDDTDGAAGLLAQAEYALARLSRFSDSFNALHERVADLMYQVQDAAEEVRDARDGLSYSADELEQIESRLDVIHKLRRKYGTTCEDILAYLDSARKELDDIEFADDHLERLKGKLQKAEKAAWDAAIALRENRKAAAEAMSERILTELTQLDMPRVQFSCEFPGDGADCRPARTPWRFTCPPTRAKP